MRSSAREPLSRVAGVRTGDVDHRVQERHRSKRPDVGAEGRTWGGTGASETGGRRGSVGRSPGPGVGAEWTLFVCRLVARVVLGPQGHRLVPLALRRTSGPRARGAPVAGPAVSGRRASGGGRGAGLAGRAPRSVLCW